MTKHNLSLKERFFKYVNKTDSCWIWTGSPNSTGYGNLDIDGKKVKAHRVSWILHKGEIPEGMYICHTCDTPLCVNPEHLFLGTAKSNMQDMKDKGRRNYHHCPICLELHRFH